MRTVDYRTIEIGFGANDPRGISGIRRLKFEVLDGGIVRSDAVFAVRYSSDGRIYRRALVGRVMNPRVRSNDFPTFRGNAPELVGWAARADLGENFARGIETDADPLNDDPDYASGDAAERAERAQLVEETVAAIRQARADRNPAEVADLRVARARADLTEWAEERRMTGEAPLARQGWERAVNELEEAEKALRDMTASAAVGHGLGSAMEAMGIGGTPGEPAADGLRHYRVVIHTSYEEVYEVAYDGDGEDLYEDEESSRGTWTRVSPKEVSGLSECGMQVQSVDEVTK